MSWYQYNFFPTILIDNLSIDSHGYFFKPKEALEVNPEVNIRQV